MTPLYTSAEILGQEDLYEIQERVCSSGQTVRYEMTPAELEWLEFVDGKYSIADYLRSSIDENNTVELDAEGLTEALEADCPMAGKAVCLSDDTALQRLCFWLWREPQ